MRDELLTDLEQRLAASAAGGGADRVARQHKDGKLTARERIAALLDEMEALASIVNSPIVHEERNKLEGEIEALKAERDALARDAARFDWYFGRTDKIDFMQTYLTGMKDGWTPDQWRAAIDAAMKGASDE